ncbi:MAG: helix-hairpin-helix domain-containing protein [Chthoniobacterales bacterium]|nr:helix-hairpin-helix domain-containing protein [Chthoniobacterales bacterium]
MLKIIMLLLVFSGALVVGATPAAEDEKVDLNTATLEELDALPHIGRYTAKRIIEMRPITDLNALLTIKGMDKDEVAALEKLVTLGESPSGPSLSISLAGAQIPVTRIGTGSVGVIVLPHSGSREMVKYIQQNRKWLGDLTEKCSLFVWAYPDSAPFDKVESTIQAYRSGDISAKLSLPGIAVAAIEQIKAASGLKQFLVVGNSLGAGLILQDYTALVSDKSLSFLLISPSESFMPPPEKIPTLERTVLIGSKGLETGDGDLRFSTDLFLKGMDGKPEAKAWHWFRNNNNEEWGDLITASRASEPVEWKARPDGGKYRMALPTDFETGHKTIGGDINAELLGKLIRVKLGLADKAVLAEPPQQR